ncbi:hypothetical protein [Rhodococcus sp. NPDC057529]|uniref:hypothetical protein n=1 Tax=Rhodococcus sp. NPDC057529 TaxID=3346158 RepID=UPI00366A5C92
MFEVLASVDVFVPSAQKAFDVLQNPLGLYEPRGIWYQDWPEWGFDARWCRVNLDLSVAPTHFEIIAPTPAPDLNLDHPHMQRMFEAQGTRLHKTHSTPVAVLDVDEIARRLSRVGATFRIDEPAEKMPFPRLWVGYTRELPGVYNPSSDGGLHLEFIPALGFPVVDKAVQPLQDGHPVRRISRRSILVDNLEETLRTVDRNLGWSPSSAVRRRGADRVATFTFDHPNSAVLDVVEAGEDGPARDYRQAWGIGPYGISLEVDTLEPVAAALHEAGWIDEQLPPGPIRPDHRMTFGAQFDFHLSADKEIV